jgi:hypothetical protein
MPRPVLALLTLAACSGLIAQENASQTRVDSGGQGSLRTRAAAKQGDNRSFAYIGSNELHVFPSLLDGGGWQSSIILTNLEDRPIQVVCEYVAPDGATRQMSFDIGTGDKSTSDINAFGTETFQTTGQPADTTSAWAYCTASQRNDRFGGYTLLRYNRDGVVREYTLPLSPDSETRFLIPLQRPADRRTDIFLINTDLDINAVFQLTVLDGKGNTKGVTQRTLRPGEQQVVTINGSFAQLDFTSGAALVERLSGSQYVTGAGVRTGPDGVLGLPSMTPVQ